MESVGQIRCPNSGQVALFPDDRYEINTHFSLNYSSSASYKSQLKKHSFKKLHFVQILKYFLLILAKKSECIETTQNVLKTVLQKDEEEW